ncbi:MAG TPA: urea ABC transporter permease subunit UrtB [Rhizomicrobium sp.]|nr:urea ABC transporter permease subunit UrtB [Rhizomicrobium sp.]
MTDIGTALRILFFAVLLALYPGVMPKALAAEAVAPLVRQLIDADYSQKAEIAAKLAASGSLRAAPILQALVDGTLNSTPDKRVVIDPIDSAHSYTDALTGTPVNGIDSNSLDRITANNSLRRLVRGLLASISLLSPDDKVRRLAAESAFTAHEPDMLDGINTAIAREKVLGIRAILEQARAYILLQSEESSEQEKLDAIPVLRARGDQDAMSALMSAATNASAKVAGNAAAAADHIRTSLSYWEALQNVYYGISLGSVLLLAAIGLAITFGVMGVINMAHGEMIMLGAYTTYVVQQTIAAFAPGLMEFSLPIAIPAAFLVAGTMGVFVERCIIRFLYGRPLETLLATWGLSLILQQSVRSIFGSTNKAVITPEWMSGSFDLGHLVITYSRLWIIVFAMVVLAALMLFLKRTHFGLEMRAVTQNRKMAAAMGVRTNWVDAFTFALGSGVAGIAGVALSQIDNVSPNLGQTYIIDSFMVVVFGGVGNLWGTLVGAATLGIANKLIEPYAGAVIGKIMVLIFIILFIQRRPRGLFALKGRSVQA